LFSSSLPLNGVGLVHQRDKTVSIAGSINRPFKTRESRGEKTKRGWICPNRASVKPNDFLAN
jgi:hypothetical protein